MQREEQCGSSHDYHAAQSFRKRYMNTVLTKPSLISKNTVILSAKNKPKFDLQTCISSESLSHSSVNSIPSSITLDPQLRNITDKQKEACFPISNLWSTV